MKKRNSVKVHCLLATVATEKEWGNEWPPVSQKSREIKKKKVIKRNRS